MSVEATRSAAIEAELELRRHGEVRHALAVRKLLASHAALVTQLRLSQRELVTARRAAERASYRAGAPYV